MKRYLAILLLGVSSVFAQTAQTTPNLITSGTTHTWTGVTTGALPANYMPGGPTPRYDPNTNIISYSYNSNATVSQVIAVNQALANVGAGVKINGYNYSYDIRNMNGDNRQNGTDTITVSTYMKGTNGTVLLSGSEFYNTKFEWTTIAKTKVATTPHDLADVSTLQFSATGGDNGYWGGYFGPQLRNVNMSLSYTVDPCATNPAYSPTCANYSTVQYSNNLVPTPNSYAVGGYSIDQSYAINQALGQAGAGATIHGFQWGYVANANGAYCGTWDFGWFGCLDYRTPAVATSVNITDRTGNSLYNVSRTYTNSYNTTSYQYLFPASRSINTLGNFNFSASTNDQAAYIGSMWSKAVYTPDPCSVDPLSSTTCVGYAQAYFTQQCTISALYNSACPGYTVAYFNQQCTTNPLYNQSCPGYASAYLVQQCSINPLYSTTCSGYDTAYFDQQCSLNPLYNSRCNGYTQAYHDQQCSNNALYATDCPGYTATYKTQQCAANALYAPDCSGYDQAYLNSRCIQDSLYSTLCEGYKTAYAIKYLTNLNPAVTSAVNQQLTVNVEAAKVAAIQDPVSAAVSNTPSTTSASSVSPTATISAVKPPPPPTDMAVQAEPKKDDKKDDKKADDKPQGGGGEQKADGPKPKSAREELAAKREEAAKKEAVAKGKDLANQMGQATSLEAQKAVQNVVIQAMGFTPGFDQYGKTMIPDTQFYRPFSVYGNQKNIDSRSGTRLFGGSDNVHQELVNSQYQLGK